MAMLRLTVFTLLYTVLTTSGAPSKDCVYKDKAVVIALLALHRGENCDIVVQRGAQQIAALDLVLDYVNSGANSSKLPQLDVKVMDTCSSTEEAVKAALKALRLAHQGCQAPMFLGLLGPDDNESLRAVAKVISQFHYPHVISTAVRSFSQFNTIDVQTSDPATQAKGIKMLLDELNWSSFYLAFTSDPVSSQTATNLLEGGELCALDTALQIPTAHNPDNDYVAYNRLLHGLQKASSARVVLICGTSESAEAILQHLEGVLSKTKFIIVVYGSGLLPWHLSQGLAMNTVILQESSKSTIVPDTFSSFVESTPLWNEYRNQTLCDEDCVDTPFVQDSSTTHIMHAINLFHEALRTGLSLKCKKNVGICSQLVGMANEDWRTHVEETVKVLKVGDDEHKLRFHMMLPSQMNVYAANEEGVFEEIGSISDGEQLFLKKRQGLPIATMSREDQCGPHHLMLPTIRPPTVQKKPLSVFPTTGIPLGVDIFGIHVKLGELGFYELIAIMTGIAVGFVLLILMMICLVYRCFRVKVEKISHLSSPSSSCGDRRPKGKKSKLNRLKLFRNSVKSVHTVME